MIKVGQIDSIIERAHKTAVDKGWWDPQANGSRTPDEVEALIHSEIAEATEAYREGKMEMYFHENGKPDGYVVELADTIIRCADNLGKLEAKSALDEETIKRAYETAGKSEFMHPMQLTNRLHACLAAGVKYREVYGNKVWAATLEDLILSCFTVAHLLKLDIDSALEAKLKYNETRPYRHGGKLA